MLGETVVAVADRYWADDLGCAPEDLFSRPLRVITHGGGMEGYRGVFALFREGAVIVSVPPGFGEKVRIMLDGFPDGISPENFAPAFESMAARVIGPAFIGYCLQEPGEVKAARTLVAEDAPLLDELENACDETEWEHGGGPITNPSSGVIVEGKLVALAGYETWGGTIAHISVITRADQRGRGFGRSAVAHLTRRALAEGLVPQYRTLEGNVASVRVAEELGFERYATSVAVRFTGEGGGVA